MFEFEGELVLSPVSNMQMIMLLILLWIFGILLFVLRRMVKVYNCDFNGKYKMVGYGFILPEFHGFGIRLGERIVNRSLTNDFIILVNEFEIGWDTGLEVCIRLRDRKLSVPLEQEMKVVF